MMYPVTAVLPNEHERRRDYRWAGGLALVHLMLLWLRVGEIFRHPADYILAPGGDGLKSYYAYLYYVRHGHGLWFTGMNYPHGEHLLYTDGFPAMALLARWAHTAFGLSDAAALGWFNVTVLLASLPATPLLFWLLRRCHVGRWWAGATALIISLLSPQFHRLPGAHLTLALVLAIPLMWVLQVRLQEAATRRARLHALGAYVGAALLLALAHPYYLLHALLLPAATAVVTAAQDARRRGRAVWVPAAWLVGAGVLPVVLFQIGMALTDSIRDRPVNPYGFLVYHANSASVFGPVLEPFRTAWATVFRGPEPIWEGWSYIGFVPDLILVLLVARAGAYLLRGHVGLIFRPVLPAPLRATVWAAVPILLLAMCWPFAGGHEDWVPHLGPLRQFRSLGRFAWIFYYVMGVTAAVVLWQLLRYLRQRRAGQFGLGLLTLLLIIWAYEAKYHLEATTRPLLQTRVADFLLDDAAAIAYKPLLTAVNRQPNDFQAILPLPYFALGSEKFGLEPTSISAGEGFRASYQTGLPLAAVMMSRTSLAQSLSSMNLFSSDLLPKTLPAQFPSRRPLLVVASAVDSLRPAEQALLRRGAHLLTRTDRVRLYELPLTAFATDRPTRERAWFAAHRDSLRQESTESGPVWCSAPAPGVVWRTFPTNSPAGSASRWPGFTRPGVAHNRSGETVLFNGTLPHPPGLTDTTRAYDITFWAYAATTDWLPAATFRQLTPAGAEVEVQNTSLNRSTEILGNWVCQHFGFRLTDPANRIEVRVSGLDYAVDDLLIRSRATNVYWLATDGNPVRNGYPLRD